MESLNQDFTSLVAYQQAQLARNSEIQSALESDVEVPSEEDAQELISKGSRSRVKADSGIPESVLTNVQQSTGISPEEINELMNK